MNNSKPPLERRKSDHRIRVLFFVALGALLGISIVLLGDKWPAGSTTNTVLLTLGSATVSTALISLVLDIFWSEERAQIEARAMEPLLTKFETVAGQIERLEGRLEAFKLLGLNYCHASRSRALGRFFIYAETMLGDVSAKAKDLIDDLPMSDTINIVSSSARGLIGYIDREPYEVQKNWRNLMVQKPAYFRLLLTHPAYAHLRQSAEERSHGDIEMEILKTAVFLHCVAGMTARQLRFYRGSPTVFTIQAREHFMLNPYPYGRMAMDTLCLEFESEPEAGRSYVSDFVGMHFSHTWAFMEQPGKLVDDKLLVAGVNTFADILDAFAECTYVTDPQRLRLTAPQVTELDAFTMRLSERYTELRHPPPEAPFTACVRQMKFTYSGQYTAEAASAGA